MNAAGSIWEECSKNKDRERMAVKEGSGKNACEERIMEK